MKYNNYKHTKPTWITQGLLKSIRYRDKLYKQALSTNPDLPEYQVLKINLKSYNVILKRSFRMGKQIYYKTCFNRSKYDVKNAWKTINEILLKVKQTHLFLNILRKVLLRQIGLLSLDLHNRHYCSMSTSPFR